MSAIFEARQRAGLKAAGVNHAVGRIATWLGLAEVEANPLQPEQEKVILTAISRLARFQQAVAEAKEKFTADLRFPSVR